MLTPKFKLSQDSENLSLWLHVPYIKYEEAQCEVSDDNVVYFSATPYYLRLHLPGDILPAIGPSKYDADSGDLTINLKKKSEGELFKGLDMLTWLLTPRKADSNTPNIEVIDTSECGSVEENSDVVNSSNLQSITPVSLNNIDDNSDNVISSCSPSLDEGVAETDVHVTADDESEWFIDQILDESEISLQDLEANMKTGCGFASSKFNFGAISSEAAYLIDVKDPNNLSLSERRQLREEQENDKFKECVEHYVADLFDDDMIKEVLAPSYPELVGMNGIPCALSNEEKEKLTHLPKKEYLIEPAVLSQVYFGLVDLLFAYAYSYRFSSGEENVEAEWIICKLSSTLSWCDSFCTIKDVVVACARRCLCFPLYRNWNLFERVLHDVKLILKCGKTQVVKCLLSILFILQKSEDRHVLNNLYITDYCVWIQSVSDECIDNLATSLSDLVVSKADVGFRLVELEADARRLMEDSEEEDEIDNLAKTMKNTVKVYDADESDSDAADESSDSDSDDDDDESSVSDNDESTSNESGENENNDCQNDLSDKGDKIETLKS